MSITNVKTKTIDYYVDLPPGWQDNNFAPIPFSATSLGELIPGWRRYKIKVELPAFGGSADAQEMTIRASQAFEQ